MHVICKTLIKYRDTFPKDQTALPNIPNMKIVFHEIFTNFALGRFNKSAQIQVIY